MGVYSAQPRDARLRSEIQRRDIASFDSLHLLLLSIPLLQSSDLEQTMADNGWFDRRGRSQTPLHRRHRR